MRIVYFVVLKMGIVSISICNSVYNSYIHTTIVFIIHIHIFNIKIFVRILQTKYKRETRSYK